MLLFLTSYMLNCKRPDVYEEKTGIDVYSGAIYTENDTPVNGDENESVITIISL